MEPAVIAVLQVRDEYTSARLIEDNLRRRLQDLERNSEAPSRPAAEVDYVAQDGSRRTIRVRDYDVRSLDRVAPSRAVEHLEVIVRARAGDLGAAMTLKARTTVLGGKIAARFAGADVIEDEVVIPYTTDRLPDDQAISNKGATLLRLARKGFATPDFCLLSGAAYPLDPAARARRALDAIDNLVRLSGRGLGDPANPLLVAMRFAMPRYIPGFMPTWLNVGLTPEMLPQLPSRYGVPAAARIRLNNRKTLLEALDPAAAKEFFAEVHSVEEPGALHALAARIEEAIAARDPQLLTDPRHQVLFLVDRAYAYYDTHLDTLRNFMDGRADRPSMIFQRMVCAALDDESYAGVLYSRHPRTGVGVHLQVARGTWGEDLMTGHLRPEQVNLADRSEARARFPAVYHFWPRIAALEEIFRAPVLIEFTGVHGVFTILQVNRAELSGTGMLMAVLDMHRGGAFDESRVRELVRPYHLRQVESDTIEPTALEALSPFCTGASVLPRSAVSGRLCLSVRAAEAHQGEPGWEKIIVGQESFDPTDTIRMQGVHGLASLTPAAIHVITSAQNLGLPTLLNLGHDGVTIDLEAGALTNRDGARLREGDWLTISSRRKTLYAGRALYAPARLLRFMAGEDVEMSEEERPGFERLAGYYRTWREILETVPPADVQSLEDLGSAVLYGALKDDEDKARDYVNRSFDAARARLVSGLFDTTLGEHRMNKSAYVLLTEERQAALLEDAVAAIEARGCAGYHAGAFIVGALVDPAAPVSFWRRLSPPAVARLLDEWVLFKKYMALLSEVGEQRINRARDQILTAGLGALRIHAGVVEDFMGLKLAGLDLDALRAALPPGGDPQAREVVELLRRPYREFYDFDQPWSLKRLKRICDRDGVPLPGPDDI